MLCSATDYEDRRLPDFEKLEEIAWEIRSKSAGHHAGFILLSDVVKPQTKERDDQDEKETPQEAPAASVENE